MGSVTATHTLPVPADKVWATITTPSTWDSWLTIHAGWLEEPPAQVTEGSRLVEKVVMLGMANKLEWVVASVTPGSKLVIEGTGMAGVRSTFAFTVTPAGDSAIVSIDAEFTGSLIVGALGKAVEKDAVQNLTESLEKLAGCASA